MRMFTSNKLAAFIVSRDGCDVTKETDIVRLIYADLRRLRLLLPLHLQMIDVSFKEYIFSYAHVIHTNIGKIPVMNVCDTICIPHTTIIPVDLQDIREISCINTNHLCLMIQRFCRRGQPYILCTEDIPDSDLEWLELTIGCLHTKMSMTYESVYYPRIITGSNMEKYDAIVKDIYGYDTNVEHLISM